MTNLRNLIGLFLVSTLFFTACKKENLTPESVEANSPESNISTTTDLATQTRAMAAVASMAHSRNGNNLDTLDNDCGCFALLEGIDLEAEYEEVEAAIDSILETLSEAEIDQLLEPVCTDEGELYENACMAECAGVSNYRTCSEEELDNYFFDEFDCEDLDNLTFPAEIELPDGTLVTVNSAEELFDLIDQWYTENGADDFDYEGDYEDTDYEDHFEDCFTVVYPISIEFPDGAIVAYDSEEALYTGLDTWYDLNSDNNDDPAPVYPFEVILPDSTTQTVNNEMEEEALWEACYGDLDFELCFEINFPITLIYPDSSMLEVDGYEALENAIDAYYTENEDSDEDIDILYPVDVTLADGTVQTLANEDDLDLALEACFDSDDFGRVAAQGRQSVLSTKQVAKGRVLRGSVD